MNRKSISNKVICAAIAAAMLNTSAAYAVNAVSKNESVYVNLTAQGTQKETVVTDWLHSDVPGAEIHDRTILEGIENIKGDEVPDQNGQDIVWKATGNDIYYRGTTNKKLPIDIKITYFLDGKEIDPENLGGKSGKVKIVFDFKNNEKHTFELKSGMRDIYTPFTVAATLDLPLDTFKNVQISEGKIFSDGDNQIVAFIAMPGLKESLDLQSYSIDELKSIDLPESIEINADVENFKLGPIMFAATPELPDMDKIKKTEDFDELKQDLKDLDKAIHDMDEMDPNKKIRSLITDPANVNASRTLLNDVFDFYDMDLAIAELGPEYVTKSNMDLYDRIRADLKDADIGYIMDNKTFRSLSDRLTDSNIDKARTLMKDADEIKTLDKSKMDPFIDVLKQSKDLDRLVEKGNSILNKVEDNEDEVDTLKTLLKYSGRLMHLMDDVNELGLDGMISEDDMQEAFNGAIGAVFDKKESQLKSVIDSGKIEDEAVREQVASMVEAAMDYKEEQIEGSDVSQECIDIIDMAIASTSPGTPEYQQLNQVSTAAGILINSPEALGGSEQIARTEALVKGTVVQILETQKNTYVSAIESGNIASPMRSSIKSIVEQAMDTKKKQMLSSSEIPNLVNDVSGFDKSLKRDLGSDYRSKIEDSLEFSSGLLSQLKGIEDEYNDNKKLVDRIRELLNDDDEMDYLREWGPKLMDMKDDMDDNEENIQLVKDLLKEYDDPKIKYFKSRVNDLIADADDARPIVESLSDRIDEARMNKSLHEAPNYVGKLLKMKNDLVDNRNIIEILRDATSDRNIEIANSLLSKLDRVKNEDTVDKYNRMLDDAEELLEKKDILVKLSDDYKVFTSSGENMDSSLKFIMKTDEIKIPEVKEVKNEVQKNDTGFFAWLKQIFTKIKSIF